MHHITAVQVPFNVRLPKLRTYLTEARRTLAQASTSDAEKHRLARRISRIETEIAFVARNAP